MNALAKITQIDPAILDDISADKPLSESTKKNYRRDIDHFNEWLQDTGRTITAQAIQEYFEALESEKYKPATLNRKKYALLRVFRQFFKDNALQRVAVEQVIKHQTPTYKINQTVEQDEVLTPEQIQELQTLASEKLGLIIRFLWETACRVSEMIHIRIDRDIKEVNGKVAIALTGKGKKIRTVKIPTDFYRELRDVFQGTTYLFETRSGNQYNASNLYTQLKRLDTDLPRNPHIFRHSRATYLLKNGFSLKAVSQFLGHSTTAITADLYIHDSIDYDEMFALDEQY